MTRLSAWVMLWLLAVGMPIAGAEDDDDPFEHEQARFMTASVRGTKATPALRRQIAKQIFDMEKEARPTCTTRPVRAKKRRTASLLQRGWSERWYVRSCEQIFPYDVVLTPDDDAETGMAIEVTVVTTTHGIPSQ